MPFHLVRGLNFLEEEGLHGWREPGGRVLDDRGFTI
jgi:hypothetical protein